ncbi:TPA: ATP-binding protein, partial [Vibrio cholerae]|nr:ATP-binding protein [Vibrio cholerae]
MSILVGEVIAVRGVKVSITVFEESNKDTLFYDGTKYKGISIREYVQIERGFKKIICIVEGEYLDENRTDD